MNKQSPPPADRFCDVVMKGGITSGVVYPWAMCELAEHYHFKNIGGTSAGAVASAATAAAEYQRRYTGSMAGFERLKGLPKELGTKDARGSNRLLTLFQAEPSTSRLFRVLLSMLNKSTPNTRAAWAVIGLLRSYWMAVLVSVLLSVAVWKYAGLAAAALFCLNAIVVSVGYWVYRDVTKNVVENGYGMCTGMNASSKGPDALTPWLHELIQVAAGRTLDDPPLTFGDLWDAPGFPPAWLTPSINPDGTKKAGVRSINLEMFTTNLSHGRPYTMPFEDPTARLFYKHEELKRFVPEKVMEWISKHSKPYAPAEGREAYDPKPEKAEALGLLELPEAKDFPIILSSRMSLSFPFLFSAIPLWTIDYEPEPAHRGFSRCMFSDGGMCSNFPMHLFDGLVPMWPTFGIDLEQVLKYRKKELVFLPKSYKQGYGERWDRFDDKRKFSGFMVAVANVMQNWNDTSLARMPGVRDRVVRVRLNDKEGGLNLNMKKNLIDHVAGLGLEAAVQLVERYVPEGSAGPTPGWDEQRWVRLNVLLRLLEKRLPAIETASKLDTAHTRDYASIIQEAMSEPPAGQPDKLSEEQAKALGTLIACLTNFADEFQELSKKYSFVPVPEPVLRVRPPL